MAIPNLTLLFQSMDGDDSREVRHRDRRRGREHSGRKGESPADLSAAETHAEARAEILLAAQLHAGVPSAFDDVFHRHFESLVRYVRRFVDSTDVAEDLAQDALIRLWQMRASVYPDRSLVPLLRTIVRRDALDRIRDLRTADRVRDFLTAAVDANDMVSSIPMPHTMAEREEVARLVRTALGTLPPRTRLVATMYWLDELGRREIARELGVSVRTVDNQVYRAAEKIHRALQPYVEG